MAYITFQPNDYFNTKLYTGNASTNAITGVGFQPDWLWVKSRSRTDSHRLIDVLRGTNTWKTDSASAESDASGDGFTSLDSDGFTLNGSGGGGEFNANSGTFAAWNWKAGGAGSSNSDGSITSTVSASTTAGFSIVKWTGNATSGATIGHGLGVAPKWVMVKNLPDAQAGTLSLTEVGWTKALDISSTGASNSSTSYWNDTAPSSSVVTLGSSNDTNGTGDSMIAYCFAQKTGFSKFGSYTGNGSADGSFIYTGFKPAFIMQKKSSASSNWVIYDSKRDTSNVVTKELMPDSNNAEGTNTNIDILSNGFKQRANYEYTNNSGATYIYMAFAEEPLVANVGQSIPATAR